MKLRYNAFATTTYSLRYLNSQALYSQNSSLYIMKV
jgi:hypothetical protein